VLLLLLLLTESQAQVRRPMAYAGYGADRLQAAPMAGTLDEPIRLYISNLDYAVSSDDIKVDSPALNLVMHLCLQNSFID
jgi:hypothetical protein